MTKAQTVESLFLLNACRDSFINLTVALGAAKETGESNEDILVAIRVITLRRDAAWEKLSNSLYGVTDDWAIKVISDAKKVIADSIY